MYPWGRFKRIKAIEIGKQDRPDRKFLVDTLLHEYLEAEIFAKQDTDGFYETLSNASEYERHRWINSKIAQFFDEMEGSK